MQIWLIRHAAALPREAGIDDKLRPLTPRGRTRWGRAVSGLRCLEVSFDALYHSPWARAVETADLLAPLLEGQRAALAELAMSPGPELLERLSGDRVALVGHEPWISELLAWLVLGSREHAGQLVFKKGGVAWLEGEPRPRRMVLRALLYPRILLELSRR